VVILHIWPEFVSGYALDGDI